MEDRELVQRVHSLRFDKYTLYQFKSILIVSAFARLVQSVACVEYLDGKHISYVDLASGDKPTEGEVVGAALTELFKLDRGFQKWKERSQKPDASSHKAGELTAPSKA